MCECACPVMLVKGSSVPESRSVVAAFSVLKGNAPCEQLSQLLFPLLFLLETAYQR
jgi:hypothetical protein